MQTPQKRDEKGGRSRRNGGCSRAALLWGRGLLPQTRTGSR